MLKEKIVSALHFILDQKQSPHRTALSVSIGTFIAFSPYHFFHTIMIFIFCWLLDISLVITFAITYVINNPWTMMFVYGLDYMVGDYILRSAGFTPLMLNPAWMEFLNEPLRVHTGIGGIAFWSFIFGGNLLGLMFGGMLYPIIRHTCARAACIDSREI